MEYVYKIYNEEILKLIPFSEIYENLIPHNEMIELFSVDTKQRMEKFKDEEILKYPFFILDLILKFPLLKEECALFTNNIELQMLYIEVYSVVETMKNTFIYNFYSKSEVELLVEKIGEKRFANLSDEKFNNFLKKVKKAALKRIDNFDKFYGDPSINYVFFPKNKDGEVSTFPFKRETFSFDKVKEIHAKFSERFEYDPDFILEETKEELSADEDYKDLLEEAMRYRFEKYVIPEFNGNYRKYLNLDKCQDIINLTRKKKCNKETPSH